MPWMFSVVTLLLTVGPGSGFYPAEAIGDNYGKNPILINIDHLHIEHDQINWSILNCYWSSFLIDIDHLCVQFTLSVVSWKYLVWVLVLVLTDIWSQLALVFILRKQLETIMGRNLTAAELDCCWSPNRIDCLNIFHVTSKWQHFCLESILLWSW